MVSQYSSICLLSSRSHCRGGGLVIEDARPVGMVAHPSCALRGVAVRSEHAASPCGYLRRRRSQDCCCRTTPLDLGLSYSWVGTPVIFGQAHSPRTLRFSGGDHSELSPSLRGLVLLSRLACGSLGGLFLEADARVARSRVAIALLRSRAPVSAVVARYRGAHRA